MNVFNRIVICLILLAFAAATLVLSLVPRTAISSLRFVLDVAEYNLDPATQLVGAVLGLLVVAAALLLLVAELRPPVRNSVVVARGPNGIAELTNESVALRVKKVAEALEGVQEASPVIYSRGKSVDIILRLLSDPSIDLPEKSDEVMQAVRTETEGKMGIPVKSLRVTVKHSSRETRSSVPAPGGAAKEPFRS